MHPKFSHISHALGQTSHGTIAVRCKEMTPGRKGASGCEFDPTYHLSLSIASNEPFFQFSFLSRFQKGPKQKTIEVSKK